MLICLIFVGPLIENIRHLKTQVLKIKQEKMDVEEKMKVIGREMKSIGQENEILQNDVFVRIIINGHVTIFNLKKTLF